MLSANDDETWDDLDIKDNSFLYHTSRGIYSYYPDKDLARACHNVLSPSFSDDDDTLSTTTSHHSGKFSVDEHDYMLSDAGQLLVTPSTSATKQHTIAPSSSTSSSDSFTATYSQKTSKHSDFTDLLKNYDGPGTITRLGRPGGRIHIDKGDWAHDLELPSALSLSATRTAITSLQKEKVLAQSKNSFPSSSSAALSATTTTAIDSTSLVHNGITNEEESYDEDPFANLQNDDDNNDNEDKSNNKSMNNGEAYRNNNAHTGIDNNGKDRQHLSDGATFVPQTASLPARSHQQLWKEEQNDEGFDDIVLPEDTHTLSLKSRQSSHAPCGKSGDDSSQKALSALPTAIQQELVQFKESEDDDFLDGLDITDSGLFKTVSSPHTVSALSARSPARTVQKEKQPVESKLPRPKRHQQKSPSPAVLATASSVAASSSSQRKIAAESRINRLTTPTYASRQRGTNATPPKLNTSASPRSCSLKTRQTRHPNDYKKYAMGHPSIELSDKSYTLRPTLFRKQILSPSCNSSNYSKQKSSPFLRSNNGSNVMARPKSDRINYGNGSELDDLDDLAVWRPPIHLRPSMITSHLSGDPRTTKRTEPSKPWRSNMSKRKVTLIKPEERNVARVINDMKYDERGKRWHGNEQIMKTFDAPTKKRPALIKSMTQSRPTKSTAAMVVGDMTFDHQRMKWNTCNGAKEVDALAHIDDLPDDDEDYQLLQQSGASRPTLMHSSFPLEHNRHDTPSYQSRTTVVGSTTGTSTALHNRLAANQTNTLYSVAPNHNSRSTLLPMTRSTPSAATSAILAASLTSSEQAGQSCHHHHPYRHRQHMANSASEFKLPKSMQNEMYDQEEDTKAFFDGWPLKEEEDLVETQFGNFVPQHTQILY